MDCTYYPGNTKKEVFAMPSLRCTAVKCVYNKDQLCSKGDIQVGGAHACKSGETACESFRERTGATNSTGTGSETIKVGCSACSCNYNQNKVCHAGAVDIHGAEACTSHETCCGTFKPKK